MQMPEHFEPQDQQWIAEQLALLSPSVRAKVCRHYSEAYWAAYEQEPTEHKRANCGRKAANTRLRLYVSRYQYSLLGYTSVPLADGSLQINH